MSIFTGLGQLIVAFMHFCCFQHRLTVIESFCGFVRLIRNLFPWHLSSIDFNLRNRCVQYFLNLQLHQHIPTSTHCFVDKQTIFLVTSQHDYITFINIFKWNAIILIGCREIEKGPDFTFCECTPASSPFTLLLHMQFIVKQAMTSIVLLSLKSFRKMQSLLGIYKGVIKRTGWTK